MTAQPAWLSGRLAVVSGVGEAAETVAVAIATAGGRVLRHDAGADDGTGFADALTRLEREGGAPLDILVHACAFAPVGRPETLDLQDWRREVSVNLDLAFLESAAFGRHCVATGRGGTILYLLPSAAAGAGRVAAATATGALDNLVKSLAVEWARDGLRVNAIASRACEPGGLADPDVKASLGWLAAYLLSDYAAYVSGTVVGVDET